MKTKLVALTILVFNLSLVYGQGFQDVTKEETVKKVESEEEVNEICTSLGLGFTSTPREVGQIIDEIVKTAGVANGNFAMAQCSNINNAFAKMLTDAEGNDVRYIIYDAAWLKAFNEEGLNDWGGKFVLAHEIGHHLNGHSLNNKGSNKKVELEADYFAGRALANLGASLDELLAVTETMSMKATYSHPGRVDRAKQATAGYKSIKNKSLTITVKQEDVSQIAKEIVALIQEKLSNTTAMTQADYEKTMKLLQLARSPKYYKGYTEDIRYLEAVTLSGMNDSELAMDSYINYLSIEELEEEKRIEQISELFVKSPSKSAAFFTNPLVVYNLNKIYYSVKEYDKAISTGNQFLSRSEDKTKHSEVTKIIALSEMEKVFNEMEELSPEESLKEAKVYIQNLNYDPAVDLLQPLADINNSEAQYLLGTLYYNGNGVTTNVAMAADLYAKAAQDNNVDAQLKLGVIYLEGVGVAKSLTNSRFWLEQASENKHPSAKAALADLSSEEKTSKKAAEKKKKDDNRKEEEAAEKKEADRKIAEAAEKEEADRKIEEAKKEEANRVQKEIDQKLEEDKVEEANRIKKEADKKLEEDKVEEANRIKKEADKKLEEEKAEEANRIKKEADKKLEEEANKITEELPEVKEVEVKGTDAEIIAMSITKAKSYYKSGLYTDAFDNYLIASKKGNPVAQERIGWMYFKGKGVKKDKELGIEWWKKAAKKGNRSAISYLTRLGEW